MYSQLLHIFLYLAYPPLLSLQPALAPRQPGSILFPSCPPPTLFPKKKNKGEFEFARSIMAPSTMWTPRYASVENRFDGAAVSAHHRRFKDRRFRYFPRPWAHPHTRAGRKRLGTWHLIKFSGVMLLVTFLFMQFSSRTRADTH